MKMYYCKTERPNFGDELNTWMWPQLLEGMFDDDEGTLFLGIGSILYDSFPKEKTKVVFGAGYGGYTPPPTIDDNWQVFFVRGRLTAQQLGLDAALAIGDAAILVRSCVAEAPPKRFKTSFMPHWESTLIGDWPRVCAEADIHYLDPCGNVTQILEEIRASELVLTEAMHGAIVSDALRVPWIPLRPIGPGHRMKWNDWASALEISLSPNQILASNISEFLSGRVNSWRLNTWLRSSDAAFLRNVGRDHFVSRAAARLEEIAREGPSLSSDTAIESAHEKMLLKIDELKRQYST